MSSAELEIPFQQNISENFLNIINQLRKIGEPGRIFELTREPTKDELKFLTNNYTNETGLTRLNQNRKWNMIEGIFCGVNMPMNNELFDIFAHYHPRRKKGVPTDFPSLEDIFCINPKGRNFIIDHTGLTYFTEIKKHPITEHLWKPQTFKELIYQLNQYYEQNRIYNDTLNPHQFDKNFLEKMGVVIIKKPWQRLPNNPFSGFKI